MHVHHNYHFSCPSTYVCNIKLHTITGARVRLLMRILILVRLRAGVTNAMIISVQNKQTTNQTVTRINIHHAYPHDLVVLVTPHCVSSFVNLLHLLVLVLSCVVALIDYSSQTSPTTRVSYEWYDHHGKEEFSSCISA
jgi:hypothetical protein